MNIGGNIDSDRRERRWKMPTSLTADVHRAAIVVNRAERAGTI
jgi:hypothetical protein